MFYPTADLEELMPDLLLQGSYRGLGEPYDKLRYVTRVNSKLGRMVGDKLKETTGLSSQKAAFQHLKDGTKGALPDSVTNHLQYTYSGKYGSVVLTGLDNDIK